MLNADMGITACQYKCQHCGQTGDTPLDIDHKPDCQHITEQKFHEAKALVVSELNRAIDVRDCHHMINWMGTEPLAARIIGALNRAGRLK